MTNVLTSVENIVDYYEEKDEKKSLNNSFIMYLKGKAILKSEKTKEILEEYIVKENGKELIKGTRLTSEDIVRIFDIKEDADIQDFLNEYPSLENEYQVAAGLLMYVKKNCTFRKMILKI